MSIETQVHLLKYRRTKIVATLGPASGSAEMIEQLVGAGVNVFRQNMSHGSHEDHRRLYGLVRAAAEKLGQPIAILADLCGPKIRAGRFEGGRIELVDGEQVTVTTRDVLGRTGLIPSQYAELADDVEPGNRILLDDGNLELRVDAVEGTEITCTVVHGGPLKDRKGINLPGVNVSAPSLTEKDRVDARFALELGVDFLALSFVRKAGDVKELRALANGMGRSVSIISKIEKPEALQEIDAIVEASDGIMIARGDLGVELPPQSVPLAQEQLIDLTRSHNKPVIVATQMLESMIEHARPTRAEVSDVSNAVRSGADAVMLSAESAAGKHPLEAVRMMDLVLRQMEGYLWERGAFGSYRNTEQEERPLPVDDAVSEAVAGLTRDLWIRGVFVITRRGRTASVLSASRPAAPIVALSSDERAMRTANLLWGVIPRHVEIDDLARYQKLARRLAGELEIGTEGQPVLVLRGFSTLPEHNQPSISVMRL